MHWTIDLVISFRKYCCWEQTNYFVLNTQRFGLYFHSFVARNFLSLTAVLQKLFAYTYLQYSSQPTHNWDCRHVISTGYYPLIEREKSAISCSANARWAFMSGMHSGHRFSWDALLYVPNVRYYELSHKHFCMSFIGNTKLCDDNSPLQFQDRNIWTVAQKQTYKLILNIILKEPFFYGMKGFYPFTLYQFFEDKQVVIKYLVTNHILSCHEYCSFLICIKVWWDQEYIWWHIHKR